jgi:hypothetical protein
MVEHEEDDMISEIQVHVIARQMFEKHGLKAIAQAAQNAQACENTGDTEEAREWRHIEDAMKMMRGPHQSWQDCNVPSSNTRERSRSDVYDGAGSENVRIEAVIITELKFSDIERQVLSPAGQR